MRPIGFSRVQTTIPRGAVIGETHYRPLTCEVGTSLHYDSDRRLLNPTAYSDIFHTIFKEYGYRVVGEPNALFEEQNAAKPDRSEEQTSELQSLMRISYAVFCLKKKKKN